MRQNDLALEAAKKTKTIEEPPANRSVVEPWGHVSASELVPGEKSEINLEVATELYQDINKEIYKLGSHLNKAEAFNNEQDIQHISGLVDNLKALKDDLKQKIAHLTTQLDAPPANVISLFEKINQDCRQFIQAAQTANNWLYRGQSYKDPDAFVGKSWNSRRVKDSMPTAQKVFDTILAKQGFTALRSNSIFTSPGLAHAAGYGKPYMIFPIDNQSSFMYTSYHDLTLKTMGQLPLDRELVDAWRIPFREWMQAQIKDLESQKKASRLLSGLVGQKQTNVNFCKQSDPQKKRIDQSGCSREHFAYQLCRFSK